MSTHNECQDPGDPAATPQQPARRRFLQSAAAAATVGAAPHLRAQTQTPVAPPAQLNHAVTARPLTLTVNGRAYTLQLEPRVTLLDALREYTGLMGTKKGCDRGQCGACTVLADGRRINSCLVLALSCDGSEVLKIGGVAPGGG